MERIKMELPRVRLHGDFPDPLRTIPRVRMRIAVVRAEEPRKRRRVSWLASPLPKVWGLSTRVRTYEDPQDAVTAGRERKYRLDIVAQAPTRRGILRMLRKLKGRFPRLWVIRCTDDSWIVCETVSRDF